MRVLLLLVLIFSILADVVANAYCICPMTMNSSVLDDDDDDEHRHHHRPHHECQHEDSTQATHLGELPQTPHEHHCGCHHHGPYWVSTGSRNLSDLRFQYLQIFPGGDHFPAEDLVEPPFRPPMSKAA